MLYGTQNELFERALLSHQEHNEIHNYTFSILRKQIVPGYWNKLLHLQSLITEELARDEAERLDWIW